MSGRVVLCWCAGLLIVGTIFVFRVAVPWLVNMQNTAALLAALLLAGAALTADFLIGFQLISQWRELSENEHEDDN